MVASAVMGVPFRVYQLWGLRLETTAGWERGVLLATERLAARMAHQVVCNSPSLRDTFLNLRLAPSSKVTVLGAGSNNGVDTSRFHPSTGNEESRRLRRTLGFGPDDIVIGFVGRLTRDKGVSDLLAAFDIIADEVRGAHLLFVGDFETGDPLPAETIERIARDHRVVVTGFVEDTAPYYRVMDLLAFPSYREGFPNAPLEAAASALPVVGYRATGTVDAVLHGETGVLVQTGDSQGLAEAICRLLSDREPMEKMATMARKRAVSLYDSGKVWQYWSEYYWQGLAERVPAFR
jgi:glycosyltransferase involved in cell wall biosynthesis